MLEERMNQGAGSHAMDELIGRIRAARNPSVMGLDTCLTHFPEEFSRDHLPKIPSMEQAAEAIFAYNRALIDALGDIVPAVKVQAAYYEMYGPAGVSVFARTMEYAKARGLSVMADVKRNDIGATAEAYASAYLGQTALGEGRARAFCADFATVTPYLGEDGVTPFVQACERQGNGIFVLVKTSNPSSGQLQDLWVGERAVYEIVGDLVADWGRGSIGAEGYSAVGAVVGATYPEQGAALRQRLPRTFFLVPGYGAQGAKGADLAGCFDARGEGAIVNASRSILCAWRTRPGMDFARAAREEALRMRDDLLAGLDAAKKPLG